MQSDFQAVASAWPASQGLPQRCLLPEHLRPIEWLKDHSIMPAFLCYLGLIATVTSAQQLVASNSEYGQAGGT